MGFQYLKMRNARSQSVILWCEIVIFDPGKIFDPFFFLLNNGFSFITLIEMLLTIIPYSFRNAQLNELLPTLPQRSPNGVNSGPENHLVFYTESDLRID